MSTHHEAVHIVRRETIAITLCGRQSENVGGRILDEISAEDLAEPRRTWYAGSRRGRNINKSNGWCVPCARVAAQTRPVAP